MISSAQRSALSLVVLPLATLLSVACGEAAFTADSENVGSSGRGGNGAAGKAASSAASAGGVSHAGASRGGSAGTAHAGSSDPGGSGNVGSDGGAAPNPEGGEGGSPGGAGGDSAGGEGFGGAAAYEGPSVGKAKTFAALLAGKGGELNPSDYYFRTNPVFETSETRCKWNRRARHFFKRTERCGFCVRHLTHQD